MNKKLLNCLSEIKRKGYDALLVSNPTNISYLTDFRKAEGFLLINENKIVYFTHFIYYDEAKRISFWKVKPYTFNVFSLITKEIKRLKLKRILFEEKHLAWKEYRELKDAFFQEKIKLLPSNDVIEKLCSQKTKEELFRIKKALSITKEAFNFARETLFPYSTEKEIAVELEHFLKSWGDQEIAFPPMVAFGKNSAIIHHLPGEKKLSKGNWILLDIGAKYCGYCADLTRIIFVDKMPPLRRKVYEAVKKAQELAIKKVKDGMPAKEVDRVAREYIQKKGWGKCFKHGIGHGVGREVHEYPYLNQKSDALLKENMVITIEPGIYIGNCFGVRLEEMVLVKKYKGEVLDENIDK